MVASTKNTATPELAENSHLVVDQRLLIHNVSKEHYETVRNALSDRAELRLRYHNENLEITTTSSPPAPSLWTSDAKRLLLRGIDWQTYETLLQALDGHHLRMTYDRGSLEFMTLSPEHEGAKNLLRRFVEVLAEEFDLPFKNLGSTTYKRDDQDRGLEPDECYYFRNWRQVLGKKRIDLTLDPPPELVVEVEVTRSSLDRMSIYASLGVLEVWRFDGEEFKVYRLGANRQYEECEHSPTFPAVPLAELVSFIKQGQAEDDTSVVRAFRAWLKKQLARPKAKPTSKRGWRKRA